MIGYINTIETMGLVDGPGIRVVVFMQGCLLRCIYCHNPETWELKKGNKMTSLELFEIIKKYKNYFQKEGGVTFSGGEPLLQADFLIEIMKKCKKNNINVCLDTAGFVDEKTEEVLKYTDLIILDIKGNNKEEYKKNTQRNNEHLLRFLNLCQKNNKKIWIRQVIIPNINDKKENILELKKLTSKYKSIEKIELIPYHTYGKEKYKKLNIAYPLNDAVQMNSKKLKELQYLLKN